MINEDQKNMSGQFETANPDLVDQAKDNENNTVDSTTEKQDYVQFKTHQKLLNQYKNQKGEVEELREFKRLKEEEELQKKGEYTKILQARDERINTLEEKLSSYEKDRTEAKKLNAFLDKLPGKIKKEEYLSFLDTDSIQIDPESGKVDQVSLDHAVNKFVTNYSDLYRPSNQKGLPSVGHMGGKPNLKRRLKDLSDEELKKAWYDAEINR